MTIRKDLLAAGLGLVLAIVLLWTAWNLLPGVQLDHKFHRLLSATGDRNWKAVSALMADDYKDAWGKSREKAVSDVDEALRSFLFLEITADRLKIVREGPKATISAHLHLEGRGNAIAEEVKIYTNDLHEDFQFAWERKSWKPWDWKLVALSQPEINSMEMP